MCACLFDADGCFYRGKVLKRLPDGQFEIFYVDYGNTETVPASHMKIIEPALASLPPMATAYKPSFIKLPREGGDVLEAVAELSGLVRPSLLRLSSRLLTLVAGDEPPVAHRPRSQVRARPTAHPYQIPLRNPRTRASISAGVMSCVKKSMNWPSGPSR